MNLEIYRVLHVTGLALLLLGLGGALLAPKDAPPQRLPRVLHGVGLLVMAIAGFGAMAKLYISAPHDWPAWLVLKMVAWFLLAALPSLVRHGTVPRAAGWVVAAVLAACGAWLAIVKPAFG
jgi:hypothetical protein